METFTQYHPLRISDNDTLDPRFDWKLWSKNGDDTYSSSEPKTVKDDGASGNSVRRATMEKWGYKGTVLEKSDGGWIIIDNANYWVDHHIGIWHKVQLKLWFGHDGYVYTVCLMVHDVMGIVIVLRWHCVHDINGTHSIYHCTNEMGIMPGCVSWQDMEKATWMHYFHGLQPNNELVEDVVWKATHTIGAEIVDEK